jgi:LmbE family N-acetylglucosaminyl deacetylase
MVRRVVTAVPLRCSRWADARWLVVAPHADDETLGAGALIAQASARGTLAGVAFVTDGAASHGETDDRSRQRLRRIRRLEAATAVRRLAGSRHVHPLFADWPDANPPHEGEPLFEAALSGLVTALLARKVDAVAVTALHEPHCDHEAACRLVYGAARRCARPVTVFQYCVWAAPPPVATFRSYRTDDMSPALRRFALSAHRSQLTPIHGDGFRLPPTMRAASPFDLLYLNR